VGFEKNFWKGKNMSYDEKWYEAGNCIVLDFSALQNLIGLREVLGEADFWRKDPHGKAVLKLVHRSIDDFHMCRFKKKENTHSNEKLIDVHKKDLEKVCEALAKHTGISKWFCGGEEKALLKSRKNFLENALRKLEEHLLLLEYFGNEKNTESAHLFNVAKSPYDYRHHCIVKIDPLRDDKSTGSHPVDMQAVSDNPELDFSTKYMSWQLRQKSCDMHLSVYFGQNLRILVLYELWKTVFRNEDLAKNDTWNSSKEELTIARLSEVFGNPEVIAHLAKSPDEDTRIYEFLARLSEIFGTPKISRT